MLASQAWIISILSIVLIIGVPGNSLIIAVYASKPRKSSAHIFILALAAVDLFVCLTFPSIIYDVMNYKDSNEVVCLMLHYTSAYGVHLAFILNGIIAVNRFLVVSRPRQHLPLLNGKGSIILILISCVISLILTIPTFVNTGVLNIQIYTLNLHICNTEPSTFPQKIIVFLKYIFMIGVECLVGIAYFKLYRSIRYLGRVGVAPAEAPTTSTNRTNPGDNENTTRVTIAVTTSQNGPHDGRIPGSDDSTIRSTQRVAIISGNGIVGESPDARMDHSNQQQPTIKRNIVRNRTNLMLITVTSVMFMSWIPPAFIGISSIFWWDDPQQKLLHMGRQERQISVLFQMLFCINHGANVIVYVAINKHFRKDCTKVLHKLVHTLNPGH